MTGRTWFLKHFLSGEFMPAVLQCLDNLHKQHDYNGNLTSFCKAGILAGRECPHDKPSREILDSMSIKRLSLSRHIKHINVRGGCWREDTLGEAPRRRVSKGSLRVDSHRFYSIWFFPYSSVYGPLLYCHNDLGYN